ncbi:MAG: hypothetical protein KFW07_03895 [Mycoplasmataceae bacterium]|nr:hypothetical protein [Mycoplasmataceae bacterium]
MQLKGFIKIEQNKASEIYGGGALSLMTSLLPVIAPAFSSIVTSLKILFSDKGEVKNKDGTATKWENYEDKSNGQNKLFFIN